MEYRPLGPNGVQVSPLGLGTMMFGPWGPVNPDDDSYGARTYSAGTTTDMIMTAEAIGALHEAMCEAMVAGNLAKLDSILADGFTLRHMTGYVQSRSEWLEAIESGEMQYHGIETVEATPGADATVPGLTARTLTDATIWGSRATWRLTLRSWFEPRGDGWVIKRTVASTW
jgi:hypothetical protein